eukprot:scaffold2914_cov178-Amphora_coffeaeformis.AAC.19
MGKIPWKSISDFSGPTFECNSAHNNHCRVLYDGISWPILKQSLLFSLDLAAVPGDHRFVLVTKVPILSLLSLLFETGGEDGCPSISCTTAGGLSLVDGR